MVAATILDFQNVKILGVGRLMTAKMRHRANFASIGQTVAEIRQFLDFSQLAAIHHLGFVMSVFGPPTKGIWWSLSLCTILSESMQQF